MIHRGCAGCRHCPPKKTSLMSSLTWLMTKTQTIGSPRQIPSRPPCNSTWIRIPPPLLPRSGPLALFLVEREADQSLKVIVAHELLWSATSTTDSSINVKLLNSGIGTKCEDGLRRRQHNLNVRFCTRSVHWLPGNIEPSLLLILGFIFISSYYHIPTTISSYPLCPGHLFCSYGFLCSRPSRFPLIAYVSFPGLALDMSILTLARYYSLTWSFLVSSFLHLPYVASFDLSRVHAVSIITHTFLNVYTSIIYHRNSITTTLSTCPKQIWCDE